MRHILFIITCLICGNLFAQELTVKGMNTSNDLSASQYRRNDYNGDACTFIKAHG